MTNEERIKSMSQDELAEFLDNLYIMGRDFQKPPPYCHDPCRYSRYRGCYGCVYDWLEEEATDEKTN